MRINRAAWIGLNTISYICALIFLGLAITVEISPDWAQYDTGIAVSPTSQNDVSRARGLWKQCVPNLPVKTTYDDKCFSLEPWSGGSFNPRVAPIISMRIAVPALQIIVIILVAFTLCTTCAILICYSKHPDRFRFRWGQYTALIGGIILWFLALIYFISLVIYYETLSEENYLYDANLLSARSAWSQKSRDETQYMVGAMIPMTWSANALLYAASILQLIASALQKQPTVEA